MNKKRITILTLTAMLSASILHSEEGGPHITGHSEPYSLTEGALPILENTTADTSSAPEDKNIIPQPPTQPDVTTLPPTSPTNTTPPSTPESTALPNSTPLDSGNGSTSQNTPASSTTEESIPPAPEEEGTPVGHAAKSGSKDARNRTWQNIGLAAATVAIAVTAIILVSSNSGHRHK